MNLKRLAELERAARRQLAKAEADKRTMMLQLQKELGLPLPDSSNFVEGLKRLQAGIAAGELEPFVKWVESEKRRAGEAQRLK